MQCCKGRTFSPLSSTAQSIDFQKIRLQELLKPENHEDGRVPRTVECELTEDVVDACIPGDVVTVMGIIRQINNYMDLGGGKSKTKYQGLYYLYLEGVSVTNSKSQSIPEDSQYTTAGARASEMSDLFSFSPRDLEFIVKFSEEHGPDVFRQMIQSVCPSIYGHELVKAGITRCLFGGVRKNSMDQNKVPIRGDIHVIVVGDPGLGKSQLLQAAAVVSPRGIYVCGNATTNTGLTVAVVKDRMTSDYAFEAVAKSAMNCSLPFLLCGLKSILINYEYASYGGHMYVACFLFDEETPAELEPKFNLSLASGDLRIRNFLLFLLQYLEINIQLFYKGVGSLLLSLARRPPIASHKGSLFSVQTLIVPPRRLKRFVVSYNDHRI